MHLKEANEGGFSFCTKRSIAVSPLHLPGVKWWDPVEVLPSETGPPQPRNLREITLSWPGSQRNSLDSLTEEVPP